MRRRQVLRVVALLLILPLLCCAGLVLPARYQQSYFGGLALKAERLRTAEGPRVIVIGGSSVAFGLDSALAEENLSGYCFVNFGLYAALGTPLMLELALADIRAGDIVIISPEQQAQTLSDSFDSAMTWQALDSDLSLLTRVDARHYAALAAALPAFTVSKVKLLLRNETPAGDDIYTLSSLNAYGDIDNPLVAANTMPGGYDASMPVDLTETGLPDADFIDLVNGFAAQAREKGASVWWRFCPMNAAALTEGSDPDAYAESLAALLDFPILGDPNDSVLDAGWFFDTNFHLNQSGQTLNTRRLVRALKAELGDTSVTAIDLPEEPAVTAAERAGSDADAGLFLYEITDSGAVITGVTEEGKRRDTLTVPAHAPDGSAVIRLADGCLSGCDRLTALILTESDPNACVPGDALTDGTLPRILVPAGTGEKYRLNYFWSVYAGSIAEQSP